MWSILLSKLRLFCWPDGFLPEWKAGAQITLLELMRHMKQKGHDCVVYKEPGEQLGSIEGIRLTNNFDETADADLVIAQGPNVEKKVGLASRYNKPLLFIKHTVRKLKIPKYVYMVYNAHSTWNMFRNTYPNESIVVHPPVDKAKYKVDSFRTHITLINLNQNKGGHILAKIAEAMPDRKFLGVKGVYGDQHGLFPSNVETIDTVSDMRDVYHRTKILLMPSKAETYGRTTVEAMSCGIPSICDPLPGLIESCSSSAMYADRANIASYVEAIESMESNYNFWSHKALDRFEEIQELTYRELDSFEKFCMRIK